MKNKRPKLFLFLLLVAVLIILLYLIAVFVGEVSREQSASPVSEESGDAKKTIVYLANNLSDVNEYEQAMLLKRYFAKNSNLQLNIYNPDGMLPIQISYAEKLTAENTDLLICNPIQLNTVQDTINATDLSVIYLGTRPTEKSAVSIYFSNEYCAQLISQHIYASVYPDSSICIVGKEKSDPLYQSTLTALQKVSENNGIRQNIISYFTNSILITDIRNQMPTLLQNHAVIVLDEKNIPTLLQYLATNEYTGNSIIVSEDEKMLSHVLDGSLNAIIYREKEDFVKRVYNTSLGMLNGTEVPAVQECYQGLLMIDNINQYLEAKKNST